MANRPTAPPELSLVPGALVRHPDCPDWGLGQVQSSVGGRVTVNFENRGKVVIDVRNLQLVLVRAERDRDP
jgi:hypothetical protein